VFTDDWRCADAYSGLGDLPPPALAWEFLRRNCYYRADYQRHLYEVALGAGADAEARRFARWGLSFAADPAIGAQDQPIFWRPDVYPRTIVLAPAPRGAVAAIPYAPERWNGQFVTRSSADGVHALLMAEGAFHRLWMPQPIASGEPVACVAPLGDETASEVAAIMQFWRHVSGAAPPLHAPADGRLRRIRMSLRALDGRHAGESYRALAERLFGAQRVADESWRTSSLRDATIRLVRTGMALTCGQYRRLLGY
jgi:hypothetical protein